MDKINKSGIYIIRNIINKKVYIGSAICFRKRFNNHKITLLKNKHHNIYLQRFVNKYSIKALSFDFLEIVLDKNKLIEREQAWIDYYKFSSLFNILKIAGSHLGKKHSKETKKKLSKIMKCNTINVGRKHTEASKKKMSDSLKGNKRWLGRKHSEESRKKISENQSKLVYIYKNTILIDKILGTINVAKKYNLHQSKVSAVCLGQRRSTGGYTMKYEENLTNLKK